VNLRDSAVLVDQICDPFCVFVFGRARGAVGDADFAFGVAQQRKRKVELFGEARVVFGLIEAGAEDLDVFLFVVADEVPEPGTFRRSARCIRLGEKPEHDFLAAEVTELHAPAVVIGDIELRRRIANLQHRSSSPE